MAVFWCQTWDDGARPPLFGVSQLVRRSSVGSSLHSRLEAKAPAGAGEVDGGDRHPGSHVYSTRREQGLLPVDLHGEGAVRQAGGHAHWARALQALGVGDLDDDGVVQAVSVGGEDGEAGDVGDLGQLGDRGGHPHVDVGGGLVSVIGDVGDDRVPGSCWYGRGADDATNGLGKNYYYYRRQEQTN